MISYHLASKIFQKKVEVLKNFPWRMNRSHNNFAHSLPSVHREASQRCPGTLIPSSDEETRSRTASLRARAGPGKSSETQDRPRHCLVEKCEEDAQFIPSRTCPCVKWVGGPGFDPSLFQNAGVSRTPTCSYYSINARDLYKASPTAGHWDQAKYV